MKFSFGRYVFGLAAIASGICALAWHDFSALGDVPHRAIFIYIGATIEVLGGVAIQWPENSSSGLCRSGCNLSRLRVAGITTYP